MSLENKNTDTTTTILSVMALKNPKQKLTRRLTMLILELGRG